ncbi:MAG: isoprenylcysteine carboxylmethyltransferase family protein [Candidatus Thorarchaeota archaeon]|nr:MAG: isoprenylcysteine carboxylmethyltransferase family protein [Candidatus Thorarchaeota archaeon]
MKMKGMEKLREKLPNYPGRKLFLIPLKALMFAILAYIVLIGVDILPRVFSDISILGMLEPFLPIIGTLSIATIALWLIGTMWHRRDKMKSEFGNLSYQMMIQRGLIGIAMIIPIIFHAFTSIRSLPPIPPVNDLTDLLAHPLLQFLGVTTDLDVGIRLALSGIFLVLGILVVRSSFITFGIDYMTVVYLYFPEESEVQEHEIYSIVRHPTYLGAVLLGAAGMFFRFTIYSILFFVIFYILFRIQIRREEIELITRFGDGYREYREKVPTLHVRFRDLSKFFKFLHSSS